MTKTDVFTDCTTITPRLYRSVLVTEDNAGEVATAIGAGRAWVDRDRRTGVVTGVSFDSDGRLRRAKVGEYIVSGQEYGLTLYQSYTADEYADTYAPHDEDPAALRAELEAVRAELEAERRKTRDAALSMRNRAARTAVTAVWQMPAHGWAELNRAMGAVYALPLEADRTPGAPTIHDDAAHGCSKLADRPGSTTCGLPVGDVGVKSDHPDSVTCPWCRDLL